MAALPEHQQAAPTQRWGLVVTRAAWRRRRQWRWPDGDQRAFSFVHYICTNHSVAYVFENSCLQKTILCIYSVFSLSLYICISVYLRMEFQWNPQIRTIFWPSRVNLEDVAQPQFCQEYTHVTKFSHRYAKFLSCHILKCTQLIKLSYLITPSISQCKSF